MVDADALPPCTSSLRFLPAASVVVTGSDTGEVAGITRRRLRPVDIVRLILNGPAMDRLRTRGNTAPPGSQTSTPPGTGRQAPAL